MARMASRSWMRGTPPHDTRWADRRAAMGNRRLARGTRPTAPVAAPDRAILRLCGSGVKTAMKTLFSGSIVMFALAAVAPFTAAAQDAALPSADQLLDKYIAAVGGKDAIQKVNSRVVK